MKRKNSETNASKGESSGNFLLNSIDNTTNAKLKIEEQEFDNDSATT